MIDKRRKERFVELESNSRGLRRRQVQTTGKHILQVKQREGGSSMGGRFGSCIPREEACMTDKQRE